MKETACRFSIIVPVYKTEKELSRCIESVLAQSFSDFEMILVDDGSPDSSGMICDSYAQKDQRVKCIHQNNQGVAAARNTGIRNAQGEYVLFLDSDDMWSDAGALTKIERILQDKPLTDVICFGYTAYNEHGDMLKTCLPSEPEGDAGRFETIKQLVYRYQYYNAAYLKVVKRELILDNGLFFESGILSEDIGWSGRLLMCAQYITVFSSAFYSYIIRKSGSITSSVGMKNLTDILHQIDNAVFDIRNLKENEQTKALYYEYWAYQYAMMLGDVPRVKNKEDHRVLVSECKKHVFLLKYHHQKKVRLVSLLYRAIGLRATMWVLSLYMKLVWR